MALSAEVQELRRTLAVAAKSWGFTDTQAGRLAFWLWLAYIRGETNQRVIKAEATDSTPTPHACQRF